MTSPPITASLGRRLRLGPAQLLWRRFRIWVVPVAIAVVALTLVALGIIGQSKATLPVDVEVLSTSDPMQIGATTQVSVQLTNHGGSIVRPRFSLSWLPYPYYWRVSSGPAELRPGATATYLIEAPDSVAAPHDGERFQVKVNDSASITYAISSPITKGTSAIPVVNPGLRMWTQQDPATGLFSPAGWKIYEHTPGNNTATITSATDARSESAYFHVVQNGHGEQDEWTTTGLQQDIIFPSQPLDITVRSRVPYDAIPDGWLVTAFGVEVSYGKQADMWLLFEPTGSGDKDYDLPNGQHIKVYDVPYDQWATRTIDLPAIYRQLNWAPTRYVTLKIFMGVSSYSKADIDGYIGGISLHDPSTEAPGG
jgi:hypothetical protein